MRGPLSYRGLNGVFLAEHRLGEKGTNTKKFAPVLTPVRIARGV